eukprot:symbB.v1.2.025494.t1/scaffold2478.1/size78220/3
MFSQDLPRRPSSTVRELGRLPEAQPLRSTKGTNYSGKDEADVMSTGFTLREITPQAVQLWLLLQVLGLLFELNLWREVSSHLSDFEDVVARECGRNVILEGPSWNASAFEDFSLTRHQTHSFSFSTKSRPPTFLVVVHPVTSNQPSPRSNVQADDRSWEDLEAQNLHWTIEVGI